MQIRSIVAFLLGLGLGPSADVWSQPENGREAAAPSPFQLRDAFKDEFTRDSREAYLLKGDVSWQSGELVLAAGASVARKVDAGCWARLQLAATLESAGPEMRQVHRVWLQFDGATPCFLQFESTLSDEGKSRSVVTLVDTVARDGKLEARPIKGIRSGRTIRQIQIDYRYGLIRVAVDDTWGFVSEIDRGSARLDAIRIEAVNSEYHLTALSASVNAPFSAPTESEMARLREADRALRSALLATRDSRFAEALTHAKESVAIRDEVLVQDHPDRIMAMFTLGRSYVHTGHYQPAEEILSDAAAAAERVYGRSHSRYAMSLNELAFHAKTAGSFQEAERHYLEILSIVQTIYQTNHPRYVSSLINLGLLYSSMHDYEAAEKRLLEAKQIRDAASQQNHVEYLAIVRELGTIAASRGDLRNALRYKQQTLELAETLLGPRHPEVGYALNGLGFVYSLMDDITQARTFYRRALDLSELTHGKDSTASAIIIDNLAMLEQREGNYDQAADMQQAAHDLLVRKLGRQHEQVASVLNNLALTRLYQRKYQEAEPLFEESLRIYETGFGREHPSYPRTLQNLGLLYGMTGRHERAEESYRQAIDELKNGGREGLPDVADVLGNLAGLQQDTGRIEEARATYRDALERTRNYLDLVSVAESERQQLQSQKMQRSLLDRFVSLSLHHESKPQVNAVIEAIWLWKGAVTRRQKVYRQLASHSELQADFRQMQTISRRLSGLVETRPVRPVRADDSSNEETDKAYLHQVEVWKRQVSDLARQREAIEQRIAEGSQEFQQLQKRLTVPQVKEWLPAETAFIDFLEVGVERRRDVADERKQLERRFVACVIRPGHNAVLVDCGAAVEMAGWINAFRRPFLSATSDQAVREAAAAAAQQIRRQLWLPLEPHLEGIKTIILSADTVLGTLPFAALPGTHDDRFLLEQYRIASVPYVWQLAFLSEESKPVQTPGLLVVGDIDYDQPIPPTPSTGRDDELTSAVAGLRQRRRARWKSLDGFEAELEAVESAFRDAFGQSQPIVSLRRELADKRTFLERASAAGTIHVVTHGYFEDPEVQSIEQAADQVQNAFDRGAGPAVFLNRVQPGLLSGLVFAGANEESGESRESAAGILRSSEIEASSLRGVGLVVLSACETGLGAVAGGEGLTGLQRAFHVAGAQSVVASFWKVEDRATQELMTRFYTNLWKHRMSRLDALRNAQLWLLTHPADLEAMRIAGVRTRGVITDLPPRAVSSTPGESSRMRTSPVFWAAFQLSGDWR